jgi:hypothetical protein
MRRPWRLAGLVLLVAWLPVWGLLTALVVVGHPPTPLRAALLALRLMVTAALLGLLVQRFVDRLPWPRPMRWDFVAWQLLAAVLYAASWLFLNSAVASATRWRLMLELGPGLGPYLVTGAWLYALVAGVLYANQATERAARAEAIAAQSQLAALRAQLNPHFLFNALHGIIQLIPQDPPQAARIAEQLAGLLRAVIEEERDQVALAEEWSFVARYLAIEKLRFGDRLQVRTELDAAADDALIPSFALQTLVENAIRHGATPRIETTEIRVSARVDDGKLRLRVEDTGDGASLEMVAASSGSGLRRLRERLTALYGGTARLEISTAPLQGFRAALELPLDEE